MATNSSTLPLSQQPAAHAPPGVTSNLVNPDSFDNAAIATSVVCALTTTLAVGARIFTRLRIVKRFTVEDYLMTLAWASFMAYIALVLKNGLDGNDRHQWNVSKAEAIILAKRGNVIEILYGPTIWLAKASLLFQLIQIFAPHHTGSLFWSVHTLIWTNLVYYIVLPFTVFFECSPREKIWFHTLPGKCINVEANFVASGVFNIVSDLTILALPIWAIWHLQMPIKQKLGVSAVFATGTFALITSIVRLIYTFRLFAKEDKTHLIGQLGLWSLAEVTTVILCGCFPIIPRLIRFTRKGNMDTESSSYQKSLASARGFKRSNVMDQSHVHDGSQVAMNMPSKGQYIELDDHRLEYQPANLSQVTTPEIEAQKQESRIPGVRKTVTVEVTRG